MVRNLALALAASMLTPLLAAPLFAQPAAQAEDKLLSGMSIVGNDEAPKSLVIVPWKSSALGHTLDVSQALDDERRPVDRDVFMRELDYYQIGAESLAGSEPEAR